jgi:hypothetical protein
VGLFDFFKRRRERESAIQPPAPADTGGAQAVVGQQVGGGGEFDVGSLNVQGVAGMAEGLEALAQLGPMIQKAIAEGNVTIEQGPSQTIDMRGTGLREEIVGIMKQHGIDPETASPGENIDAAAYGDMQQQILAALAKHGIDPNASGSSIDFRVQREED